MKRFDWSSLNTAALRSRLAAQAIGHGFDSAQVSFEPIIASTNTALLQAPFVGRPQAPHALISAEQSAGRGRQGRVWLSEPGRSACLSLALEFTHSAAPNPGLPLAIGVGLALAFQARVPGLALKWPNDLLRAGRKCAGILIESRRGTGPSADLERIVVGVGLNLLAPSEAASLPACGLFDAVDSPELEWIVSTALEAMLDAAMRHRAQGLQAFTGPWGRLDAYQGLPVVVSDAGRTIAQGINLGLGTGGALRVMDSRGEVQVITGDVSLRPAVADDESSSRQADSCAR
jgi:BirA family biotin operon repressor/biotin-[acetyl-CoA-carboxylase] ligase